MDKKVIHLSNQNIEVFVADNRAWVSLPSLATALDREWKHYRQRAVSCKEVATIEFDDQLCIALKDLNYWLYNSGRGRLRSFLLRQFQEQLMLKILDEVGRDKL